MMKNNNTLKKKRLMRKIKMTAIGVGIAAVVIGILFWIFLAVGIHLGDIASQL